VGTLFVTPEELKLHVVVDPGIVDLTRALIPKHHKLNRTRYPPHISVIRRETWEPDLSLHGTPVTFTYDPTVAAGPVYWWLRAWSDDLLRVRASLGLPALAWACRPPSEEDCFHITVGNTKVLGGPAGSKSGKRGT
jgi:hypothetical protein